MEKPQNLAISWFPMACKLLILNNAKIIENHRSDFFDRLSNFTAGFSLCLAAGENESKHNAVPILKDSFQYPREPEQFIVQEKRDLFVHF